MRIQRIRSSHEAEKKKVAVYCRVSTTQAEQEDSLEIQKTAYIQYIESQPEWELAGVYYDSKTGLNAEKREGFMEMIADSRILRIRNLQLIIRKKSLSGNMKYSVRSMHIRTDKILRVIGSPGIVLCMI